MRGIWLLLCGPPLLAQSLHVFGGPGSPGEEVQVDIVLVSPAGHEPSALQWEVSFPAAELALEGSGAGLGIAARDAGKGIQCAEQPSGQVTTRAYRCLLAGGQKTIRNGPVAALKLKVGAGARRGDARVRITHAIGVSADLKKATIPDAEGVVTIRP
ncbi:MAG TPA: hypothetical protein VFA33_00805 [Bryobacteraceae bacterium]|nr:hypothetical protein [Bryobacteraceae bacterium]